MVQVAPTLVPLLKFYFHEEVRKAAVFGTNLFFFPTKIIGNFPGFLIVECLFLFPAMPELLRSAKLAVEKGLALGRNESYVKELSDHIVPALLEALHEVIVGCYFLMHCILDTLHVVLGRFFFLLINTWIGIGFQEPDTEICGSMLDALNECLQVCRSL